MKTAMRAISTPKVLAGRGVENTTVTVEQGEHPSPDYIHIYISEPGKPQPRRGTVFLHVTAGTVDWSGKTSFSELDGCVLPTQLDRLIHCLTLARTEAAKIGLLEPGARPKARTA